ncbi:MAG: hypothetical protein JNM26_13800, partial [Ideonella sp.]|nr:hypothetical protein [Ideonella sp.]
MALLKEPAASPRSRAQEPRAARPSGLDLLTALERDEKISREASERAAGLLTQLGIAPVAGLLRLNAIAELPLYRYYAQWLGVPLIDASPDELPSLKRSAEDLACRLDIAPAWAQLKGFVLLERQDGHWLAVRDAMD